MEKEGIGEALHNQTAIWQVLTDVGLYSYAGLCAVSLRLLFHNDGLFCKKCINDVLEHLNQPDQVKASILAICDDESGSGFGSSQFIQGLREEPVLKDNMILIPTDLISLALNDGIYDARMRVLILHISCLLKVKQEDVALAEELVVEKLKEEDHVPSEEEKAERKKRERNRKIKRAALIGLATVGGGTLIGLTGGLAAPFVAAGAGAIIGGAGAAALGSVAGVAIIGSLFGVAGAGLAGYKMNKRVGGLSEFQFLQLTSGHQLAVTIAVSGWLQYGKQDFTSPWMCLANSKEQYCIMYESKYLEELGKAMDYFTSIAVQMAVTETLKTTILSGLLAAVMWPMTLISAASVIDNPWSVCIERSKLAGKQLAEVLLSRQQGKRPVTLIGFSLGARVIFCALEEMASRKGCEGIVEDVILLGAPVSGNEKAWKPLSKVVAGKIINGYCRSDWLLKFLYRTASVQLSIAGLAPVKWHDHRMLNIDLTDLIKGHMDYMRNIESILEIVGIKTLKDVIKAQKMSASPSQASDVCVASDVCAADLASEVCDNNEELFGSNYEAASAAMTNSHSGQSVELQEERCEGENTSNFEKNAQSEIYNENVPHGDSEGDSRSEKND